MEFKEDKDSPDLDNNQKNRDEKNQNKWYLNPDEWAPSENNRQNRILFDDSEDIAQRTPTEVRKSPMPHVKRPFLTIALSSAVVLIIIFAFVNEARLSSEKASTGYLPLSKKSDIQNDLEKLDWITQDLLPENPYSRPGIELERTTGLVLHNIGNPGTTAKQNRDYFASLAETQDRHVSSHFIVCLDGSIIQCVPVYEMAYASNIRNEDTLSIEVCHPDDTGRFTDESYAAAVRLAAWLLKRYNMSPEAVIRHFDVQGKECPRYFVDNPDAWETFKANVAREMERD